MYNLNFNKMKRLLVLLSAVALVFGLVSCGGKQEELTKMIPASAVTLKGEHKDLIKIASDSVKIILQKTGDNDNDWEVRTVISLSSTKPWSEVQKIRTRDNYCFDYATINAQYIDSNGTEMDLQLEEPFLTLLKSEELNTENITLKYLSDWDRNKYDVTKEMFDKISGLCIKVQVWEKSCNDQATYSSNNDKSDGELETKSDDESGSTDWDSVLDEYEKYVDKYVATYKKAMNGDMNALSEYVSLAEQAEKLSNKLSKGQGSMTTAQMNRYTKITTKMANAMQ